MRFNDRPAHGRERNQRQLPSRQVLLVLQRSITCYQNFESGYLGRVQKFSVLQPLPPQVTGGEGFMTAQEWTQIMRDVLVQQHFSRHELIFVREGADL